MGFSPRLAGVRLRLPAKEHLADFEAVYLSGARRFFFALREGKNSDSGRFSFCGQPVARMLFSLLSVGDKPHLRKDEPRKSSFEIRQNASNGQPLAFGEYFPITGAMKKKVLRSNKQHISNANKQLSVSTCFGESVPRVTPLIICS